MNKFYIILLLVTVSFNAYSQELDGKYFEKNDSVCFSSGRVKFSLSGFGALSTCMVGEGKYEILDDYLLVHTSKYSGSKSSFQQMDATKKDTILLKITGLQNYPIQGALIDFLSDKNKVIFREISDQEGIISTIYQPKIKHIKVTNMGFHDISFDLEEGKEYNVKLAPYHIIEDKILAFKIKENDKEETMSLLLLSDDLQLGKDAIKTLNKAEIRAQKSNVLPKRLTKEYISTYQR